jgi:D-alanyl-D-alanine carboxypeptidase
MESQEPQNGSKLLLFAFLIIALIGVNFFFGFEYSRKGSTLTASISDKPDTQVAYFFPISEPNYLPIYNPDITPPNIDAKSILIYDLRSGRSLYEKNSSARLPVASLTKIMSAVIVLENYNISDIVTVTGDAVKVDGERQELYEGERISVESLLKMMLIESSNDAAYALAQYAKSRDINFIDEMNKKASQLKMHDSYFNDPAGLNDSAYSTADDLSKLTKFALAFPLIWETMTQKDLIVESIDEKIKHITKNTNLLLGVIPNIIGGKTGYTDSALGCLVLVVEISEENDNMVSVVLGSNDRFGDTEKLVNWIKRAYRWE